MALIAVLLAIQVSPWWYPTPDAVAYLSIARGIAVTHRLSNLGGAHLAYPPGYPLLISPAFLISSRPFLAISIIHWLMALIFMVGVYRWTCRMAPAAALLLTALSIVNVAFWIYYRRTLSELAFMTVMIWTVVALDSALEAGSRGARAIRTPAGTVLLAALVSIREPGILFAPGFAVAVFLCLRAGKLRWTDGLANNRGGGGSSRRRGRGDFLFMIGPPRASRPAGYLAPISTDFSIPQRQSYRA